MLRDVKIVVLTVAVVFLVKTMTARDVATFKAWGHRAYVEVFK